MGSYKWEKYWYLWVKLKEYTIYPSKDWSAEGNSYKWIPPSMDKILTELFSLLAGH